MPSTDHTIKVSAGPELRDLGPEQPDETQTAWQDPWAAARTHNTWTPYNEEVRRLAQDMGHRISQAISADPAEAERLRRARQNARAGRLLPRHSDT
jgi:hypothetical protein